jgi:hypothetical protein
LVRRQEFILLDLKGIARMIYLRAIKGIGDLVYELVETFEKEGR